MALHTQNPKSQTLSPKLKRQDTIIELTGKKKEIVEPGPPLIFVEGGPLERALKRRGV